MSETSANVYIYLVGSRDRIWDATIPVAGVTGDEIELRDGAELVIIIDGVERRKPIKRLKIVDVDDQHGNLFSGEGMFSVPNLIKKRLRVYNVVTICDCGRARMVFIGPPLLTSVSGPPEFLHKCPMCGKEEVYAKRYPATIYEEEDDDDDPQTPR